MFGHIYGHQKYYTVQQRIVIFTFYSLRAPLLRTLYVASKGEEQAMDEGGSDMLLCEY